MGQTVNVHYSGVVEGDEEEFDNSECASGDVGTRLLTTHDCGLRPRDGVPLHVRGGCRQSDQGVGSGAAYHGCGGDMVCYGVLLALKLPRSSPMFASEIVVKPEYGYGDDGREAHGLGKEGYVPNSFCVCL